MMDDLATVRKIYERFNARDIDGVLITLTEDVTWANGMDGGYEHGRDAVRSYWTRQWAIVSPHVEPVQIERRIDGTIAVDVRQIVRNLDGEPLHDQTHGLSDKIVVHLFTMAAGKVARFDIAG